MFTFRNVRILFAAALLAAIFCLAGFYKLHKEAEGEYGSEAVAEIETGV